MIEKIGEQVSVSFIYNRTTGTVMPRHIKWKNQLYLIQKVGLHYTLYHGTTLVHMFSVSDESHCFLLSLDTQTLHWRLEEITDNQVN